MGRSLRGESWQVGQRCTRLPHALGVAGAALTTAHVWSRGGLWPARGVLGPGATAWPHAAPRNCPRRAHDIGLALRPPPASLRGAAEAWVPNSILPRPQGCLVAVGVAERLHLNRTEHSASDTVSLSGVFLQKAFKVTFKQAILFVFVWHNG